MVWPETGLWCGRLNLDGFAPTTQCDAGSSRMLAMRKVGFFGHALALGLALVALADCKPQTKDTSGFPRSETFYVAGRQWGEPASFNPLLSNPDWPVNGMNLLYETLLLYNPQTGQMEPLLAESHKVGADSVEVTLNPAARWSDGKPVTGWDVKYTYDLGQRFKNLPMKPIWTYLKEIQLFDAAGQAAPADPVPGNDYPRRVVFVLDPKNKNPLVILDSFVDQRIMPRHQIEPLLAKAGGNIDEVTKLKFDKDAVTSGPYKLFSYSSEKIAAVRNDQYWGNQALYGGKKPVVKYVVHPIYKSNEHFSIGLRQGRLDASSTFIPRIWRKNASGVHSWFDDPPFFVSGSIPMLFINVKHKPLDDVHYRRAMGFAVNYKDIRELAVSGYSDPLKPGLILPFGLESKFYSEEDAKQYGTWFDPEKAKAELKAGGYASKFGPEGELIETLDSSGKRVPTVFIKSPTGWTDWESIVRIAVKGMREVGIDAREKFVDASLFWNALFQADFDMIMNTPASNPSPSKPWSRFETIMTTQDFAPVGDKMYKNMGRFNDPNAPGYIARIDELLTQIPTITDEQQLITAYRELNRIYMQQQPTLPLVYRPDQFYEFSNKTWSNMPTAKNPYLPPQIPGDRLGTKMLWSIKATNAGGS